MNTIMLDHKNI